MIACSDLTVFGLLTPRPWYVCMGLMEVSKGFQRESCWSLQAGTRTILSSPDYYEPSYLHPNIFTRSDDRRLVARHRAPLHFGPHGCENLLKKT